MPGRFRLRGLLILIAVGASLFAFARPAAAAGSAGYYIDKINAIRASRGVGALAVDGQLTAVAQSWSQQMAASGTLSHNPNVSGQVSGWRTLGENVGTGPDDPTIEAAFENSPHHFENMVDPSFNAIGVAVVQDATGTLWVTEEFKQSTNAPRPAPAPAAPKPAAPKPAAPKPAPKPASAPRPAPAPVHAAPVHAVAAPSAPVTTPVATTAPPAPPATAPLAVLGSSTERPAPATALGVSNPFTAANLTGLVALVALGASMALVARVRVTRPISG